jgi:chemotaxis protein MotB
MGLFRLPGKQKNLPVAEINYEVTEENPAYRGETDGEANWLMSYADMMTLLCGFFIMLFSVSSLDQKKYAEVKKSVAEQFGGKVETDNLELKKNLREIIEAKSLERTVRLEDIPGGVAAIFQSTTFFESGSASLTEDALSTLKLFSGEVLKLQKSKEKQYRIQVEGHSDHRRISGSTFPSNWELSSARAARVVRFLIDEGFNPQKMTALGFAETRPIASPREPASVDDPAHEKNRRVVIQILRD